MLTGALAAFALCLIPAIALAQQPSYSKPPTSRQIQSALEHLPSALVHPPANPDMAQPPSSNNPPSVIIQMNDELPMYEPSHLTIKAGETVEWKNNGIVDHSASDNALKADDKADAALPPGAAPFYSGPIMPGHVYRYTFTVPGTYKYFCDSHESDGMLGEIVVKPAAGHNAVGNASQAGQPIARIAQDPPSPRN
jgi:plastocyanin